ncbi:MAG: hypothetical protein K0Q75_2225, partial [Anaerospora sp.]|nr:hypothetical protein [Anaerospora sp.]
KAKGQIKSNKQKDRSVVAVYEQFGR